MPERLRLVHLKNGIATNVIASDGSTEFYGDFLNLISSKGITKIRGTDYDLSFPPDAENANGILNRMIRTSLLEYIQITSSVLCVRAFCNAKK